MNLLPIELQELIHGFVSDIDSSKNVTNLIIKSKLKENIKMKQVNHDFYSYYKKKYNILDKIKYLINKYTTYQKDYEEEPIFSDDKSSYQDSPSPIIYDMVLSGCDLPYAKSTFEFLSSDIIDDLNLAIKLLPESINYQSGYLRCRSSVSVLHAACINQNVPIRLIKLLIENGANKDHKILLNGESINILDDLATNIPAYRFELVKILFSSC